MHRTSAVCWWWTRATIAGACCRAFARRVGQWTAARWKRRANALRRRPAAPAAVPPGAAGDGEGPDQPQRHRVDRRAQPGHPAGEWRRRFRLRMVLRLPYLAVRHGAGAGDPRPALAPAAARHGARRCRGRARTARREPGRTRPAPAAGEAGADRLAGTDPGRSGTGKELVARTLRRGARTSRSSRSTAGRFPST